MDKGQQQQRKGRRRRSKSQAATKIVSVAPVNVVGTVVTKKGKVLEVVDKNETSSRRCYRRGSTPCLTSNEREIEFGLRHVHIDKKWQPGFGPVKSAWGPPPPQTSTDLKTIIATEKKLQIKPQTSVELLQPIKHNQALLSLFNDIFNPTKCLDLNNPSYKTKVANEYCNDVNNIKYLFDITMWKYEMTSIEEIVNPFQLLHYQTRKKLNPSYQEKLLFHGTMLENVDSISTNNFDWRMVVKDKYGRGVSFSTTPYYASFYGDNDENDLKDRVMFAVKVLVGYTYTVEENEWHHVYIPKPPYDTTTDPKERVHVKYDDSSFYPAFVIYYRQKNQYYQYSNNY